MWDILNAIPSLDIVDKNGKLVLGLVWTLIQKFVIAGISLEGKRRCAPIFVAGERATILIPASQS